MKISCGNCFYLGDPKEFNWDRYINKYNRVVVKAICPICKERYEKVLKAKR